MINDNDDENDNMIMKMYIKIIPITTIQYDYQDKKGKGPLQL
jgi:major membrane immunogen (membrane-anchored lipoprotein)